MNAYPPLTPEQEQCLYDDWQNGVSQDELQERFCCSQKTLRRILHARTGVPHGQPLPCPGWEIRYYVVGHRASGASVVLWQSPDQRGADLACERLQFCEGYVRIVVEPADQVTAYCERECAKRGVA